MASIDDSFRNALSNFKKRLTKKEQEDFAISTLEDVKALIARIQHEQGSQKTMMNMTRIQSFLEAMDQFSNVVEVFLNASEFVAFIWGPLKFILQVASTWADSFEILLDAYEKIGERIPLLQQYQTLFDHSPHMRRLLEMIYSDILDFHKRALRFFTQRVWRQFFRSAWKDFKTRFDHILGRLHNHGETLKSQASLLHFQQYQDDRVKLLYHVDEWEQEEALKKKRTVIDWISGPDSEADHIAACETRENSPSSGRWILENPKLQNWKDADVPKSSMLWMSGIPGAGKTILASLVIDECLEDKSYITSYFYCKDSEAQKINCASIFRGLLSQIIQQDPDDLVPYCHDKCNASGESTLTSARLAKQILELFCQRAAKQYIVIDGLDECSNKERMQVVSFFKTIVDRSDLKEPGKIRVMFVSQDINDIRKELSNATWVQLGPSDNAKDIEVYVHSWTHRIQRKFDLADDLTAYITDTTCIRSEGMFLFAKLVMLHLDAQLSREKLKREVSPTHFPSGLGQAYQRIMTRVRETLNEDQWREAQKLFGWMVCARRSLKWLEIQAAISTDTKSQTVDFDERKLRMDIRDLCGSLVQILPGDRVELVHGTAKQYIVSSGFIRKPIVECNLTSLCLQYLTFECFELGIEQPRLDEFATNGYLVFQDYAVANWSHHLRAMVEASEELCAGTSARDSLDELDDAVRDFAECYEDEFPEEIIDEAAIEACGPFRHCDFGSILQSIWSHIHQHQAKGFEARNDVSIKALGEVLARNRKFLEELTSSTQLPAEKVQSLESVYGDRPFKCSKLTCFYFHQGFKDAKTRKSHIDRHDRPFQCSFPDCSVVEFGFGNAKELERHEKLFHPSLEDQSMTFAIPKTMTAQAKFPCHMCTKRFTRGFHLRSHIRTHMSEKPFACSECGKAFTRANDCKRHEKLHARR